MLALKLRILNIDAVEGKILQLARCCNNEKIFSADSVKNSLGACFMIPFFSCDSFSPQKAELRQQSAVISKKLFAF